ncbi:MAG: hypothetical protein RLZZ271_323 [Pseudomonadota bacterium]|jgi:hypothetical protein
MRRTLLIIGFLGFAVFSLGLFLSYARSILIESAAREIVRIEVENRVGQKIDTLSDSRIAGIAKSMADKVRIDSDKLEQEIRKEVPKKVAQTVADMLKADCECRKRMIQFADEVARGRLSHLVQIKERLQPLIEGTYAHVRDKLLHEFRIFCAANALVFLLLLGVVYAKGGASLQLLLPTVVLLGAALLTAATYLFKQNWIHTIMFNDYVGYAYFSYLLVALVLLCDVLLNRSKVSTVLIVGVASVLGVTVSALSC